MNSSKDWWKSAVIYQIYPRSFQDSNNDGIGDLRGIIRRLDYLHSLHITAIWISPIYPSPMADFGYDVSDYCAIHPLFGTLADFKELLSKAHSLNIKIVLDLVPNHSSSEHPWFLESKSNKHNPKRDWYIWKDPKPDGSPPNNWLSYFGGPAWTLDDQTGQYYLHQFAKEQPELNYRNPDVFQAILDVMRFWLDLGVDGFRVDVIWLMMKDPEFKDEPINPSWDGKFPHSKLLHPYTANLPEVHDLIKEMRKFLDTYPDKVLIGELYLTLEETAEYYGETGDECHIPLNHSIFPILSDFKASKMKDFIINYIKIIPDFAYPNYTLGNHDQKRLRSRVGNIDHLILTLLFTLKGTIFTYYGEELGMTDGFIPPDKIVDPQAIGNTDSSEDVGRDPYRTPMQWDAGLNAGFTSADTIEPWLPIAENYPEVNVERQSQDPDSPLNYYRRLATFRNANKEIIAETLTFIDSPEDILLYKRGENVLVIINFSENNFTYSLDSKYEISLVHKSDDVSLIDAQITIKGKKSVILKQFSEAF